MSKRTIVFQYHPVNNRTSADCGDIYNWLLDQNEPIAQFFHEKYIAAEKYLIKEYWENNK